GTGEGVGLVDGIGRNEDDEGEDCREAEGDEGADGDGSRYFARFEPIDDGIKNIGDGEGEEQGNENKAQAVEDEEKQAKRDHDTGGADPWISEDLLCDGIVRVR